MVVVSQMFSVFPSLILSPCADTAGVAGTTFSGDADGGNGDGFGPGGNAYSGASGSASGGGVYDYGGAINNAAASSKSFYS